MYNFCNHDIGGEVSLELTAMAALRTFAKLAKDASLFGPQADKD